MKKIRTLIVDDEALARDGIATMLESDAELEVVGTCANGVEALDAIRDRRPDLLYLDIQMPRLNGFETLERLGPENCPTVIFVTAYDQYAVRAFESGAAGYLLKPFRDSRFREALDRAKQQIRNATLAGSARGEPSRSKGLLPVNETAAGLKSPAARLAFKVGGDYLFVDAGAVVWVRAEGEFVQVCVGGQIHRVRESLQAIEDRLDRGRYARIHRSFIVNMAHVARIAPTMYGDYTVLMSEGTRLRLSRSYRHALKTLLPGHFA
ncbi:MAG: two component transcriptional regulator, LytTR family [Verrucomicrobia bacterium]|nr:two component transcriptional regulator, LytTR family [Verrucomicrobiota bacterium]